MWNWDSEYRRFGLTTCKSGHFNIGYEITDKICENGYGNSTAIICRSKTGSEHFLTYDFLSRRSSQFANFLKDSGVLAGDRVFVYSERSADFYIALLGILKRGAILGVLFSSFGEDAIVDRLSDCKASTIIVEASLLNKVLSAKSKLDSLKNIIVIGKESIENPASDGIIDFYQYKDFPESCSCRETFVDSPALINYTSGTTGKPKGVIHVHGLLVGSYSTSKNILGLQEKDIYLCTADTAWITGISYGVLGPLSNLVTSVSYESSYSPQVIFNLIQEYSVNVLYTAPTLLRMMMNEKEETIRRYNFSTLRHIASVGEALNPKVIRWAEEFLGLPVHDTWFQTETGCIMIANSKSTNIFPGSMGKTIEPVQAEILDDNYLPVPAETVGHLAIKPPWPSMFKAYWNAEDAYTSKFVNEWYMTGDKASKDINGYFWFTGRNDDIINTAGHLISPFEVESTLIEHSAVAESAVVGIPDELLGEKIVAFIVLKPDLLPTPQLKIELRSHVRKLLSPFAVPQEIEITKDIPKTKTGKIIRRILREEFLRKKN
ncbi:MAG: AMP-binding protein [Deltaproteobacteria bacterium]